MSETIHQVRTGKLDHKIGNTLGNLCKIILSVLDHVQVLDEIEEEPEEDFFETFGKRHNLPPLNDMEKERVLGIVSGLEEQRREIGHEAFQELFQPMLEMDRGFIDVEDCSLR